MAGFLGPENGDHAGEVAVLLASAIADEHATMDQGDGVRVGGRANGARQQQVVFLLFGGNLGATLQFRVVDVGDVGVVRLHQEPAPDVDEAWCSVQAIGIECAQFGVDEHAALVALPLEQLERILGDGRGDDSVEHPSAFRRHEMCQQNLRQAPVDDEVDHHQPTHDRSGVTRHHLPEGFVGSLGNGCAAGIAVFAGDGGVGGPVAVTQEDGDHVGQRLEKSIHVPDVVEAGIRTKDELEPVDGQGVQETERVERRFRLPGVLAVLADELATADEPGDLTLADEARRSEGVAGVDVLGGCRHLADDIVAVQLTSFEPGKDLLVLARVGDDDAPALGSTAQQAGATNVGVLGDLLLGGVFLRDDLRHRVEVRDDEVDVAQAELLHVGDVGVDPAGQEPGVDLP